MKHGLMDCGGDRSRYPNLSRDWEDLDCNATSCQNNRFHKCLVPSKAKINKDGKCEGFLANVEVRSKKPSTSIMDLKINDFMGNSSKI